MKIKEILESRILILDGAMGTMIQRYKLTEEEYRGKRFRDAAKLQKGKMKFTAATWLPEPISSKPTRSMPTPFRWMITEWLIW